VRNDLPRIFYSTSPALLLIVDGEPVLTRIEKTELEFVINTNWDLFFAKSGKRCFLLTGKTWLMAQELAGPWTSTQQLPKDMTELPANENWDDVKRAIPPQAGGAAPRKFFSDTPAELIPVKGNTIYSRIPDMLLLHISFPLSRRY
jgi:hypothetical protein